MIALTSSVEKCQGFALTTKAVSVEDKSPSHHGVAGCQKQALDQRGN